MAHPLLAIPLAAAAIMQAEPPETTAHVSRCHHLTPTTVRCVLTEAQVTMPPEDSEALGVIMLYKGHATVTLERRGRLRIHYSN